MLFWSDRKQSLFNRRLILFSQDLFLILRPSTIKCLPPPLGEGSIIKKRLEFSYDSRIIRLRHQQDFLWPLKDNCFYTSKFDLSLFYVWGLLKAL